jgi:lipoprotein LpqH
MDRRSLAAAAAVVLASGMAGCSAPTPTPAAQPGQGEVAAGTARVAVNNQDLGNTDAVACSPAGSLTTITTGDPASGTTAILDNARGLRAKSVSINNLAGFTGSYWQDLDGAAEVHMTGRTYLITGTAAGFSADQPSARTSAPFAIRVSC